MLSHEGLEALKNFELNEMPASEVHKFNVERKEFIAQKVKEQKSNPSLLITQSNIDVLNRHHYREAKDPLGLEVKITNVSSPMGGQPGYKMRRRRL
jgi:hypothetical protein